MFIASWNVNSLKVRLPQVLAWLDRQRPDVLALQETKVTDEAFPADAFREAGWHVTFTGQKTYNGVAIVSRHPAESVSTDPIGMGDGQRRALAATVDGIRLYNLYVPNGKAVDNDAYQHKLTWLAHAAERLHGEQQQHSSLVVAGDFNIAPTDDDVFDPEGLAGTIHCSDAERAALQRLLDLGLADSFHAAGGGPGRYSWWDYRANAFRRDRGLRIDLILASGGLVERLDEAGIDVAPRRNERPSDHAPVYACFT